MWSSSQVLNILHIIWVSSVGTEATASAKAYFKIASIPVSIYTHAVTL
jgi:hypothetical protein